VSGVHGVDNDADARKYHYFADQFVDLAYDKKILLLYEGLLAWFVFLGKISRPGVLSLNFILELDLKKFVLYKK
jgi:hypothetical protein